MATQEEWEQKVFEMFVNIDQALKLHGKEIIRLRDRIKKLEVQNESNQA